MSTSTLARRNFLKKSALGIFGISLLDISTARAFTAKNLSSGEGPAFYRYPAIDDESVSGMVGASHGNFEKVKQLIGQRPELANAAWDWGFGDFETAIGAASHVGRRDIAEYLISHGARPDIFTFTMLGMVNAVKAIIETVPGIQSKHGPHGITLMAHARNRLSDKNITSDDTKNVTNVLQYLQSLGDADLKPKNLEISDGDKEKYLGEYRFDKNEKDLFIVSLNSRKMLQVARKGSSPRTLYNIDEHTFSPSGAPSVRIVFKFSDNKAVSFSVHEPEPLVNAIRI